MTAGEADLIDAIYDALERDGHWSRFLQDCADAIGARATVLFARFVPPDHNLRQGRFHGIADEFARSYATRLFADDPILRRASALPPGSLFGLQDVISTKEMATASIVHEWLEPQDFTDLRGLVLARGVPYASVLIALTNAQEQPFAPGTDDLLGTIGPHLRRALALQRRLVHGDSLMALTTEILERLPGGVLCIGASGRVVLANARARATLALGDGVANREGRLHVQDSRGRERVRQALAGALGPTGVEGCASVERFEGGTLTVLTVPLRTLDGMGSDERSVALMFLHDPAIGKAVEPSSLGVLFGLTPSQARMAALLAEGRALDEIAVILGVTLNTVRTRIKQIYERTGTSRQAELVRRVVLSAALFLKEANEGAPAPPDR